MTVAPEHDAPPPAQAVDGRIVSIDMLRGFAIVWVVLFHLWEDIKMFPGPPVDYYSAFQERLFAGEWSRLGTSFTDAFMRIGYQGVPLFMMLSGLSLYLAASRREGGIGLLGFYRARFRRVLVPYWAGYGIMIGFVALTALFLARLHGSSFGYEYFHGVTMAKQMTVHLGWSESFDSLNIVSRALYDDRLYIANGSLWFVVLIVQYYLLFPFLKQLLDRVGPMWFALMALTLTVGARLALVAVYGDLATLPGLRLGATLAPFRIFEFALGMSVGYLLVKRRDVVREFVSTPADIAGVVMIGLLLEIGGSSMDARTYYLAAFSTPMVILGLTLIALPMLAKPAGRLETNPLSGGLAWTGMIAFAVLIINEPVRVVASALRVEEVPGAWWWLFLTAAYMPLSVLPARPLAVLLGLVPGRPAARAVRHGTAVRAAPEPAAAEA